MRSLLILVMTCQTLSAQLLQPGGVQVKITEMPFPVGNAQQVNQIVWTQLGTSTKETIYCVSEAPVSQLRFMCVDCHEKNITDMVNVLNSAQDLTRSAGFPTVALRTVAVNTNWTGATIICQAAVNGGTVDSAPAAIDIRYLRQPHVVDTSNQGPVLIANQGNRFYVECVRGADGLCQQSGRRKTLRCQVQSHPPATTFRWLKNGVVTSGNGAEITIGTEMIGQSIQCSANNGLFSDAEMPTSQAVQIDPYSSARLVQDNFATLQSAAPFQAGNRIEMNQKINLGCQVEGNPRPVVFWKLRRSNGEVVDAACAQGFDGQYQEVPAEAARGQPIGPNNVRLNAVCTLSIANYSYSGQYWCTACSYVSQGAPECSPSMEAPGSSTLNVQVQGPPMQADQQPTIEQALNSNNAVVTVHYCAEPMPRPPREVVFSIDNNDIQVGQSWENLRFESTTQNNTVPNCYMARLLIAPVREEDQDRALVLKLQNQYGARQIPVDLSSLLGGGSSSTARLSGWWIAVLCALALLVSLACLIALCVNKQLCCFNKVKTSTDHYSEPKAKANLNVRDTLYAEDTAPRPFHSPPSEQSPYEAALQSAYGESAYGDSRMSSV